MPALAAGGGAGEKLEGDGRNEGPLEADAVSPGAGAPQLPQNFPVISAPQF
jgi:hypothetical protein